MKLLGGLLLVLGLYVPLARANVACTLQTEIRDVIGPATVDLLHRVEKRAENDGCGSILLLINTPGGALDSTRTAVEMILNSKLPFLCLVAPSGGHAGSAGAIILQACHVNGALHGTNLGAATPVAMGQDLPKDLRQKILNDTRSWMESLTRLRGRSRSFGQDIITDAKAVTAEDALKLKAIDFVGSSPAEFLKFCGGREVTLPENKTAVIEAGEVHEFALDARYNVLSLITDPEIAYMLLLGSLGLLYFEITHSGVILPGVVGGVGFILALIAMHKLEVEWAGLILLLLGAAMLIAEMFLPTFGVIGIGGVGALVLGSLFLFDPVKTGGYHLPYLLVVPTVVVFAGLCLGLSFLLLRTRRVKKKGGFEDLLGLSGRVVSVENQSPSRGFIELRGETWKFAADGDVALNESVQVTGYSGLVLKVEKSREA